MNKKTIKRKLLSIRGVLVDVTFIAILVVIAYQLYYMHTHNEISSKSRTEKYSSMYTFEHQIPAEAAQCAATFTMAGSISGSEEMLLKAKAAIRMCWVLEARALYDLKHSNSKAVGTNNIGAAASAYCNDATNATMILLRGVTDLSDNVERCNELYDSIYDPELYK